MVHARCPLGVEPSSTKPLYEVQPPSPFEKATVTLHA